MSQNFNEEFIPKIGAAIEQLQENVIANIKQGLESVVAMADATGSDKFKKSASELEAGTQECMKAAEELVEVLTNVKTQYEKMNAALN